MNADTYEFRAVAYLHLRCTTPARISSGLTADEIGEMLRALRHVESYADFGIGCEMPAWEDRANREDCYCDWWKADWVKAAWAAGLGPEEEEHSGGCECDPFGDSSVCSSDCEGSL